MEVYFSLLQSLVRALCLLSLPKLFQLVPWPPYRREEREGGWIATLINYSAWKWHPPRPFTVPCPEPNTSSQPSCKGIWKWRNAHGICDECCLCHSQGVSVRAGFRTQVIWITELIFLLLYHALFSEWKKETIVPILWLKVLPSSY